MEYRQYINGQLVLGEGKKRVIYSPGTGEPITTLCCASKEQTEYALQSAKKAFATWSKTSIAERGQWILKLREALCQHEDELIDLLSLETGKPYPVSKRGFTVLVEALQYYLESVKRLTGMSILDQDSHYGSYHLCEYRPLGVVVGHLAWNMPLLNIGAKLAPVLASGCTCVLKPASVTPLTALKIGEIANAIDFPAGVFNFVSGPVEDVATVLNKSPIPAMITLIGSSETGKQVIRDASGSLRHYSLELGGNAPAVVMPDADIEAAAKFTAGIKMNNCGQICTAVNRAIVHESVYDEFLNIVKEEFAKCKVGWGKEEGISMGPMITEHERSRVIGLIEDAVKNGATLVCGGEIPERKGNYITPAILTNVTNDMKVCQNEIFGPVLPIMTFKTIDEAIEIANQTTYGLTAYAFTKDLNASFRLSEELEAGTVIVNVWGGGLPIYYPHGGWKESGLGKEWSPISVTDYFRIKRMTITP